MQISFDYSKAAKFTLVIDEAISVDFGDEEIQKHMDTKVLYDEEWINRQHPDRENFEEWLVEFVDRLILTNRGKC